MGHRSHGCWRLNESILSDPISVKEIEGTIENYFQINNTLDVTPSCLWVAHKAVIRGKLIQIASQIHRARRTEIAKLEQKFFTLSRKHKANPKSVPTEILDSARTALNLALTTKAEKWLWWSRSQFYCHGDKIGSMFVGRLTPKIRSFALPKIKIGGGTLSQNPQRIMGEFQNFYKSLYSGNNHPSQHTVDQFLYNIQILNLEDRHHLKLEAPISSEEVSAVIKNLKSQSAAGPDG